MPEVDFTQKFVMTRHPVTAEDVTRWLKSVPPMSRLTLEVDPDAHPQAYSNGRIIARWSGNIDD